MKTNNRKLLVAVFAMAMIIAAIAVIAGGSNVSADTTQSQLIAMDTDGDKEIGLTEDIVLTEAVTLDGYTINCGTHKISTAYDISGGTNGLTINTTGSSNNTITLTGNANITNVDFKLTEDAKKTGMMPFAINTQTWTSTIKDCTFASTGGDAIYGAVHTNGISSHSCVVTIDNSQMDAYGVVYYKGAQMNIINGSEVNLSFALTEARELSDEKLTITDSTVGWTIVGWAASTTGGTSMNVPSNVVITKDVDLGELSVGDSNSAADVKVELKGNVTAYGGGDIDLTIDQNATLIVPAGKTFAAGTLTGQGVIDGEYTADTETDFSGSQTTTGTITTIEDGDILSNATVAEGVTLKLDGVSFEIRGTFTNNGSITTEGMVTVADGATFTNNGTFNAASVILTSSDSAVDNNGVFTAGVKDNANWGDALNAVIVQGVAGDYTISQGSIDFDGTITGNVDTGTDGKIIVQKGNVVITGSINGNITIESDGSGQANVYFYGVSVNNGARLTLSDDANINYYVGTDAVTVDDSLAYMYLYGTIVAPANETVTVTVNEGFTFRAYGGAELSSRVSVVPVDATSEDIVIDLGQAQSTLTVSQDIVTDQNWGQLQSIVIDGILSIKNNSTVIIQGDLLISEGTILTIESGSSLIVNGNVATVTVEGTIEVIDGATFSVEQAEDVSISGTVNSYGTVEIVSGVTIEDGGVVRINDGDVSSIEVTGGLTIEVGGELAISAEMNVQDITNNGTVTLNGAVLVADSTISLTAANAVVNVVSVTADATAADAAINDKLTLTIDDLGLKFADDIRVEGGHAVEEDDENSVIITLGADEGVAGLTVTEAITGNGSEKTPYVNDMHIAGSIAFVYNGEDDTNVAADAISVAGDRLYVSETLTLGAGITLQVDGDLTVSGTIYAIAGTGNSASDVTVENGTLTVTGLVQLAANFASNEISKVNAAYYTTAASGTTPAYHWYTNFVDAVAANPATVYVYGEVAVEEDVTVPSPMVVRFGSEAVLVIGDVDNRDVTITIANGATVRTGEIQVNGTLYFENKRNDSAGNVISDVRIEGDVDRTYTNIYTALADAQAGDTVTITINNADNTVWLDSNLTIKDGVTLDVPNTKYIGLNDGVTLTVDGTLKTAHAVKVESDFAERASTQLNNEASAIIVNGTFMSMDRMEYADVTDGAATFQGYQIPGAYYQVIDSNGIYNYITPIEAAAEVSAKATDGYFKIYGEVSADAVTFTGTEAQAVTVQVMNGQTLTVNTITLSRATLDVDGNFNGTVASAVGTVELVNVDTIQVVDSFAANGTESIAVSGTPTQGDADGADASVTIATGNVTVVDTLAVTGTEFEIASGATLTVTDNGQFTSEGNAPTEDSTMGAVIVNGTLVSIDGGNVDVNYAAVFGTVTVAETTTDNTSGSASFNYLYAGISFDYKTEGAAAVNGDVTINQYMVVSNDATVEQGMIEDFRNSIVFNVEDVDWITAYSNGTGNITVGYAPIQNAILAGWSTADFVPTAGQTSQYGKTVAFNGELTVYADINYDIYSVVVIADEGIGTVYIDGKVLTKISNVFVLMNGTVPVLLDAGEHTISYTLKNSFTGDIIMSVNGETVTGNVFTLSGVPTEGNVVSVTINLTGAEPSAPTTPTTGGSSDEMGLTDYLLIILVVLIVIMAIMVAMRLMRS